MKHSLKSIIALILCVVMLSTTILTSCNSGDSGGGNNYDTSQSTPSNDSSGDNSSQDKPSENEGTTDNNQSNNNNNGGGNEQTTVLATGVTLNKTTLSLIKGGSETLTATVAPTDTTDKSLTWKTSNANVATVSNGTVTAVGAGTATITVTTVNGKTATCEVTVSVLASGVSLNKNNLSLIKGGSETLTATVAPADTTDKTLTWVSSNTSVATVSNGTVTAVGAGTATITVTTANGKTATCEVTVSVLALGVSLTKNNLSLIKGSSETLTATVAPADTTDKNLTWESSNTSVATVVNGIVTAVGAGTATITVTTVTGKTATCEVTVSVLASGVSLNKNTLSLIKGSSETLTATVAPADTTDKTLTWASSNTSVATVANGTVTAIGAGSATITVTTANGKTATCEVTVSVLASGVSLNKNTLSLINGNSETLTATVAPADTTDKTLTWTSSNPSVATVANGTVTAVGIGTATITVRTANGQTATCEVTVQILDTQYIITYHANGGTNAPSSEIKTKGENTSLSSAVPTNNGHIFMGWLCVNDGESYEAGATFIANGNVELYAIWGHTCSTCQGVGTMSEIQTCSRCSGDGNVSMPYYTSERCTSCSGRGTWPSKCSNCQGFGGYIICRCSCGNIFSPNETGTRVCSSCQRTVSGSKVQNCMSCQGTGTKTTSCSRCNGKGSIQVISGTSQTPCSSCNGKGTRPTTVSCSACEGNKTIADYNRYNVTLKDGNTTITTSSVTVNRSYTLTVPTKNGYTFMGWFDALENGTQYTDASGKSLSAWLNFGNKTLYAQWKNNCDVTLNQNISAAGSVSGNGNYAFGSSITITATTNEGYTFLGWYQNGSLVSSSESYTVALYESKTFEARWKINTYTVSLNTNIDVGGTVCGGGDYEHGTSVTVTATTNTGYTFLGWYEGDHLVSTSESYTFAASNERILTAKWEINQYTVTVNKNISSAGTVSGSGIYNYGSSVTVKATTKTGYTFLGWYEGEELISTSNRYTFTVSGAKTLTAKWSVNQYTVTLNQNIDSAGDVIGGGSYDYGSAVTVNATTETGYTFLGWYEGDELVAMSESYTFTVSGEISLTAKWGFKVTLEKNISVAGTLTGSGSYEKDSSVTVKATTNIGYTFLGWYENEELVATSESYTFTVSGDRMLIAKWSIEIALEQNISEAGTLTGSGNYEMGESVTVTATTNTGYAFLGWYEGEELIATTESYTFTVSTTKTLTAQWGFEIALEKNITSAGALTGSGNYEKDSSVTVKATTNTGYTFLGWYEGTTRVSTSESYTFTVSSARTLTAKWGFKVTFEKNISAAGTLTGSGNYEKDSSVTVKATTNIGYNFLGWYEAEELVATTESYTFTVSTEKVLTAKWEVVDELLDFKFTSTKTTCTITGIKDNTVSEIVIPNIVTSIGDSAFRGCYSLANITIPSSVTHIGDQAFYQCIKLTSITIPNSVTSIGNRAFNGCTGLKNITIPSSVTSIGEGAFNACSGLTSFIVDGANTAYTVIDGNLYSKDGKTLIQYVISKANTSFVVPDSVTTIGSYAFAGCVNLTSITIPGNVTSIGDYAFCGCSSLTSITIPNKVTGIGDYAFAECMKLKSITIPDSVTSIGEGTFVYCMNLTSVKYCGTSSQWLAISKGSAWDAGTGSYTITYNYTGE